MITRSHLPLCAALAAASFAGSALAVDLGTITLFGQVYQVHRLNYSQVTWADPLDPSINLPLIQVEGALSLGNDRVLLSTDSGDDLLTLKNWVIEAQINRDTLGAPTGLSYVRTVLINDPNDPTYGGFDLSPCGLAFNTSATGLAANGNLLVADSEANGVKGYSFSTGALLGDFSGGVANDSFDDLAFAPSNGLIYTINEDGFRLVPFTTDGVPTASYTIPGLTALNASAVPGSPKGLTFLADTATVPASIRATGGSLLITLDDNNPGLQVLDLAGNVLATEPLTTDPIFGAGAPRLDTGADCTLQPQFEACAFDAATGTIFLINEGDFTTCSGFFILTPVVNACPADFSGDGFVDDTDFVTFAAAYEAFTVPPASPAADLTGDSFVDDSDFVIFAAAYEAFVCP